MPEEGPFGPNAMKVHDSNLAGPPAGSSAATAPDKARQAERLAPDARRTADPLTAESPDKVSLSALSAQLRAQGAQSPERAARLAELVRSGRYQIDAAELSRRLVDDALTTRE